MSDVLPKERQTAYQRWELASFGDNRPSQQPPPQPAAPPPPSTEAIAKLNEELALIREEARRQGHADGVAEGHKAGLVEGRAQAAAELQRLRQLADSFGADVARANEVIAEDLLTLALDIAKAMLKTALTVKPELVLPIVGEAVRYLPGLQQPALLFLHPDDATLVKEHMADELTKAGWRIAEDVRLERGGCRIETASNQIDATTGNRWERIAADLGKESSWL
ncbi:MAG: flagellar assembly protein FliH [Burkholderiaceae bacterium]|nr:flagellar assembly protein FliH [Burkholderiaceae bacterium]